MKQYVCGFMRDSTNKIALVRKNKPKWQAGLLNGIGGGVEENDGSAHYAMCREWKEETGIRFMDWQFFAELRFDDCAVHFFKDSVESLPYLQTVNDIGEAIEIHNYATAVRFTDMIPNLKWLLPLAFEDPAALPALCSANDNPPPATQVAA